MKKDYTEAQALRDKGLTLAEVAKRTGLKRSTIAKHTTKILNRPSKPIKEGNQDLLYKGIAKVKPGLKKYDNLENRDEGKRKVQVNRNTWIYTDAPTDEEAIERYNRRQGLV